MEYSVHLQSLERTIRSVIDLPEVAWEAAFSKFQFRQYAKHSFLVREGDICNELYFISRGLLRMYYLVNGSDTTRYFARETEFGTALRSFLTQTTSQEWVQVLEPADVLVISYRDLQELMATYPAWDQLFRLLLEAAYVNQAQRIEDLICLSGEARYQKLVVDDGDLIRRVPLQHLATYLGLHPQSLSRIRGKRG